MTDMTHTVHRVVCLVLVAGGATLGFERSLDLQLINEAISLGESRVESVRTRFHQPYRVQVGRPPIDYIDIVTPYRRIVQITEDRARAGARSLGQPETMAAAGDRIDLVEVIVELTFHPLNRFVGVPAYDVELATAASNRIQPRQINRLPRFGARVSGAPRLTDAIPLNVPGPSEPMLGGTLIAGFDAPGLDAYGVYDVVISEMGKELARTRVDLGRLR